MARFEVERFRSLAKRALGRTAGTASDQPAAFTIELEYEVRPDHRHGYDRPAHPEIEAILRRNHERYRDVLRGFTDLAEDIGSIPLVANGPAEPFWHNGWFQGVDFIALYGFVAQRAPARVVEIGSGNSTRLVRRAIERHGLKTHHVSIDPSPRRKVVDLVDEHIAQPLEDTDLGRFQSLEPGDILFFDGSHRSFTNSDVTVMFNEVLPRLAPGVLVHVHDIFLPWDYPPHWADRWYSEQYLLASWLLAGERLDVVLPCMYVCLHPDLHHTLDPVWDRLAWAGVATNGSSFWFEIRSGTT